MLFYLYFFLCLTYPFSVFFFLFLSLFPALTNDQKLPPDFCVIVVVVCRSERL